MKSLLACVGVLIGSLTASADGQTAGEKMVFDGNAGNFFARSGWEVEGESDK